MQEGTTTTPNHKENDGIVGRIRSSAAAQLNSQKDKATEGLGTVATAVRESTQNLRTQQHDVAARYVEQAADQIERLSTRLREKDVTELLRDAQELARRRPALFVGAAFAVGLMGARFLKSSASDRHDGMLYRRDMTAGSVGLDRTSTINTPAVSSASGGNERY